MISVISYTCDKKNSLNVLQQDADDLNMSLTLTEAVSLALSFHVTHASKNATFSPLLKLNVIFFNT